jgi:hypothetical protein
MNTRRYPGAFGIALAALFAALFFFAGYSVKTVRVAGASSRPIATPTPADGNPSGHFLAPSGTFFSRNVKAADLIKELKLLKDGLAIRYVTASPGEDPHCHPPTCRFDDPLCAELKWPSVTIKTYGGPLHHYKEHAAESLDVYITFSFEPFNKESDICNVKTATRSH